jgi:hypothetical protein
MPRLFVDNLYRSAIDAGEAAISLRKDLAE